MARDLFDYKFEILQNEIEQLQEAIRSYDTIVFTIKGWCITVFSALIFVAIDREQSSLLVIAACGVALFWMLDAINKSFQSVFIARYRQIEHYLRTKLESDLGRRDMSFTTPQVTGGSGVKRSLFTSSTLKALLYPHTSVLYVSMMTATLLLWLLDVVP